MSQSNTICANCGNRHGANTCHVHTCRIGVTATNNPRSPGVEHGMKDPIDMHRLIAQNSSNQLNNLNVSSAPGSAGIVVTDQTTYTFNFSATPIIPVMADYVNANLLCEDLFKWGSQMEKWAMAFQRFATEMDEIVKLPCVPHFMIDQHGFTVEVKMPTGQKFEADVQRALERGMTKFDESFAGRIASVGAETSQHSMRTQQLATQQPVLQHSGFTQDESQAPDHEAAPSTGSPAPKKGGRGRGGGVRERGRGGRTTDKVVKVKKEPTEKKTPAKRTSAKRNSASNTAATKTPGKATAKAAVIENTEDLTVAANLVVSMEPDVIIRNFQASIDNERFDHADLDATIAFECV